MLFIWKWLKNPSRIKADVENIENSTQFLFLLSCHFTKYFFCILKSMITLILPFY